jgi:hypothetical protein
MIAEKTVVSMQKKAKINIALCFFGITRNLQKYTLESIDDLTPEMGHIKSVVTALG